MGIENRITYEPITELYPHEIFVFGSNLSGRHGKGAAKVAYDVFGAKYGLGFGPMGQSYAIPTKDKYLKTMLVHEIEPYVNVFLEYAKNSPNLIFKVTKIGCGLAGFTPPQIAPLFRRSVEIKNIHLPIEFWNNINEK